VGAGATEASAATMASSWADERFDSEPMPPVLPAIAPCSRASVAPPLAELASAPWQDAQWSA
jgi:hypothetical protein